MILVAKGLSPESTHHILATRRKIFSALEAYIRKKHPEDKNRVGDITFFILSPLQVINLIDPVIDEFQSIANVLSEDVLVTKLSGVAKIDQLMEELILSDAEEQKCMEARKDGQHPITLNDCKCSHKRQASLDFQ